MISGSIVALVTPMFEDGAVDWESLDGLLDMHVREGTGAVVSVGTTGESATLSVSEHLRLPMTQLAPAYHDQLKTALIALNLL